MSKKSEKEFSYYVMYIFFIPFRFMEFIVDYLVGRYTDRLFGDLVYRNIRNQWLVKFFNILSKIIGWFFCVFAIALSIQLSWIFFNFLFDYNSYKKILSTVGLDVLIYMGLLSFFIAPIRYKISQVIESSEYQQSLSGIKAENIVKKFIGVIAPKKNGWLTYNNILLVFNKGLPAEWSREIDHLLIGNNSVYMVETKYKSGTIYASIDCDAWRVENNGQESKMRNALKQVIDACEIFDREFNLPKFTATPIVAIVGNNVKIVNAPTNVVSYLDLGAVISAFEVSHQNNKINTHELINSLNKSIATDKQSFERHIKRAEEVKRKYEYNEIVSGAHTNY